MPTPVITGKGVFTPEDVITNDELVASFNAYATAFNEAHAAEIAAGEVAGKPMSSAAFITQASGIERRHVMEKSGVLDPTRMAPRLPGRADEEPSLMAEIALKAARPALEEAGLAPENLGAILCAASNMERPYPAMAVEIQALLGAPGFAFDMNVACSSATFAIQVAADMIRAGSITSALIVSPEITSGHLEWRDRDCHFIFGDVCTALVIEADAERGFAIRSTKAATQFSNNIRNNNGFLRRAHDQMDDRRDMQFMQNGRKVFKEVLPLVSAHIEAHLAEDGTTPDQLRRLWLHQANKSMNDYIGRKVLGREPEAGEQPNILQDYANTSSAGSIIAFAQHSDDIAPGERGLICSFGAGYSVGSVVVERI
ncbi:beta-ketoacyl-ACP synthase III [Pseudoroseicyclus tamaricis]|uniref:Beta-ketoacyl-ACP synthase III n=1 Tax=Pseudoroseicyclus tamaricis TaxID=2705421 RepID=A0A6B2JTJ5_9RHOB|nr:beta-ketoacyl-ACP synthase III [Pseudoroseicyclus tamaricis]NDU99908.1 beta-ketoacyl-ACP synthase III [Pseudoroseicyclus tamaricis]